MYAVLETGSKQYRVAAGDTLEIERLDIEAGKPVTFDRVLLVNHDGKVSVGSPTVSGASVVADVVEHKRGEKKLTFKMKRRKGLSQNHRPSSGIDGGEDQGNQSLVESGSASASGASRNQDTRTQPQKNLWHIKKVKAASATGATASANGSA